MSLTATAVTAVVAGLVALGLTRWMRGVARVDSPWLRYYLHVGLAAGAGAGASLLASNWAELLGFTLLGIGCALLFVVDLAAMRLPNIMVGPLYLVLLAALGVATILTGDWLRLLIAVGCAAATVALYLVMAMLKPGQLGMGDVKFAGVLGMFLGWLGWGEILLGLAMGFLLVGAVAMAYMFWFMGGLKSKLPLGPFMVIGAAIGAAIGLGFLVFA